jgi:chorismate mutase
MRLIKKLAFVRAWAIIAASSTCPKSGRDLFHRLVKTSAQRLAIAEQVALAKWDNGCQSRKHLVRRRSLLALLGLERREAWIRHRCQASCVELTRHNYHSNEGDLFIYVPEAKFLMAVDSATSGYVPFQDFDLSTNFHEYLKMFDEILAYKFDNFIGGHLTDTGTRTDVEITKEYTNDVYQTVKRIHNGMNERAFDAEIAKTIGPDNEFLIFKAFLDKVTRDSVAELEPRWINRLAGVDVWLPSHTRAALIYVRWDDKE